jgi:TfoX/Sxy family transcriptional regulator of competence genes
MSPEMSMPKPSEDAKAAFRDLVPADVAVAMRPMFGNLAAFVNGNMFTGLFGEDLFVRLPEDERRRLMAAGGRPFEPMPGRAMGGYVLLDHGWRRDPGAARKEIALALEWARGLPAKAPKTKKK